MFGTVLKGLVTAAAIVVFSSGLSGMIPANAQSLPGSIGGEHANKSLLELGLKKLDEGDYRGAERIFIHYRKRSEYNSHIYSPIDYPLGLSLVGQKEWARALRSLKNTIQFQPENHHARLVLGLVALKLEDRSLANRQLRNFERQIPACADTCEIALINATDMLRAAIDEVEVGLDDSVLSNISFGL